MDLEVMGGWLQLEHGVDVHSVEHAWEGLRVDVPMGCTYVLAGQLAAPEKTLGHKWSFYIVAGQSFLPDRFTRGDLELVRLDMILKGRFSISHDLLDLANRLLADALVFAGSGIFSRGKKEEWTRMVRGYLRRAGVEIPEPNPTIEDIREGGGWDGG